MNNRNVSKGKTEKYAAIKRIMVRKENVMLKRNNGTNEIKFIK